MSRQSLSPIRLVNVTTTQRDALTPAEGDIVYNSTVDALDLYADGAWQSTQTAGRTTFSNADFTILPAHNYVAQTGTLTAARTITLPAASAVRPGKRLLISDESGTATNSLTLTYNRAGSDVIANEADIGNTTSLVIREKYGKFELISDGTSKWMVVGHGTQRPALYWQHDHDIAIPDDVWVPIPWNAAITDDQGFSPGFDAFATTIAAGSAGVTLPTATINVADTTGFPTSGYLVISGPPQVLTAGTSTVATDVFTKTAHGFVDGQRIKINGLTNTTGVSNLTAYFVRDKTANTFKVALTFGGTAINLTGGDDTGLVFWTNDVDTVVGYTGKTGTSFTGCNTSATNIPHTNISTGTLATGQVVTGANCRFDLGDTPFIYNGVASIEWAAHDTGRRGLRWRSATAPFYFPGVTEGPLACTGEIQNLIAAMQPAAFHGNNADPGNSFVEAYQTSGGVLDVVTDGIQSPLLMICYGSGR